MRLRALALAAMAIAIISALATLRIPVPSSINYSASLFYAVMMLSSAFVWLNIGAALIFVSGLGIYKQKLRRAYYFLCASIVLLAFSNSQVPIVTSFDLWESIWISGGLLGLPFILAGGTAYFGVRALATLIGTEGWFTRTSLVIALTILLSWLTAFIPHVSGGRAIPETGYNLIVAIISWSGLMYLVSSYTLVLVRKRIGAHYKSAVGWMLAAFGVESLTLITAIIASLTFAASQNALSIFSYSLGVVGALMFIKAGLAFVNTKEF